MATSLGALCNDFSVASKLSLKMDLPGDRETLLHLLDRVRKTIPEMSSFHPYENELILESSRQDPEYRWLSLNRRSVHTAYYNPPTMAKAYAFHKMLLEVAPFHLTISPLDVDTIDLTYRFDFECRGNHDDLVFEALYGDSPLSQLLRIDDIKVLDVQPYFNIALEPGVQAFFEVKTRNRDRRGNSRRYRQEPISLFMTVRRFGPVEKTEDLQEELKLLATRAEALATDRFVPHVLMPISRSIASSSR